MFFLKVFETDADETMPFIVSLYFEKIEFSTLFLFSAGDKDVLLDSLYKKKCQLCLQDFCQYDRRQRQSCFTIFDYETIKFQGKFEHNMKVLDFVLITHGH